MRDPIPISRPDSEPVAGKRGKARIYPFGRSAKDLNATASSLQIAWAIPREVGALTYNDADRLVIQDAVQLARATPLAPVAAVPVRPVRTIPAAPVLEDRSLLISLIDGVADLFTIGPGSRQTATTNAAQRATQSVVPVTPATEALAVARPTAPVEPVVPTLSAPLVSTQQEPPANTLEVEERDDTEVAAIAATTNASNSSIDSIVQPATAKSAWVRASDAITLVNPIERFRVDPIVSGASEGERVAVADIRARISDPANIRSTELSAGAVTRGELLRQDPQDTDILLATASPARQTVTRLSVKLHPEVLGRYSASALAGLAPRRNQRLKQASVGIGARTAADTTNLNAALKERGLELDLAGYNRFERIYWGGEADEGYWISLPNRINAQFVLVSGPTSSVIATVRRRSGIARASRGVAEALELKPREWSKLRIIGLRANNQSAALPFLIWSSVLKGRDVVQ